MPHPLVLALLLAAAPATQPTGDLRGDRRFYFRRTSLAAYFAVWNAYNRKNVRYYYWNWKDGRLDASYQWARFPFLGIELAF